MHSSSKSAPNDAAIVQENQLWRSDSASDFEAADSDLRQDRLPLGGIAGSYWMLAGVLAVTLVAYLRSLTNGFVWDDNQLIVANRFLDRWSYLRNAMTHSMAWWIDPTHPPRSSYYRPVVGVVFWISHRLFGQHAMGWHATMLLLHLTAIVMVFVIARRLTRQQQVAALAALLFALLPSNGEAIVWISALPYPLTVILELAALYLFVSRTGIERRNWTLALAFYAAALLSYEGAVVFPALIASYVFLLESEPGNPASRRVVRALVRSAPFALEVLVYFVVRRGALGLAIQTWRNPATNAQLLMTAPAVLATYLSVATFPWMAGPFHRLFVVKSPGSAEFYLPVLGLIAFAAVFWLLVRNHPRRPLYLFCAAWMAITIAPVMNLSALNAGELVCDRYLYIPSVGWCILLAEGLLLFVRRRVAVRGAMSGVAVVIGLTCAVALWRVQGLWHDNLTLFTNCVARFPEREDCRASLGGSLRDAGDLAGAEREFRAALSLEPKDGAALYSLGLIDAAEGRVWQATRELADGLRLSPYPPADAYVTLAELYDAEGQPARSQEVLKHMESLPDGAEAAGIARARIQARNGDRASAEATLRALARRYPDDGRIWTMLGLLLHEENRPEEALNAYSRALRLVPRDARPHYFAAVELHAMGRDREALGECRAALALDPEYSEASALVRQIENHSAPR